MTRIAFDAALALTLPAAAFAKGPSEASIAGPGLDGRISFPAYGDLSGLYAGSLRADRPAGDLGPRYEAVWTFPFPGRAAERVRQHIYPYADPFPVTYTPPGQRLWGKEYAGGWYVGSPRLREVLAAAGLPAEAPEGGRPLWPWPAAALAVALAAWFARARWISGIRTPTASSASTSSTPTTG